MHDFTNLVDIGTSFALDALNSAEAAALTELEASGSTPPVEMLQAVNLQKAITAVGALSMFEAMLQDSLGCDDGFKGALEALRKQGAGSLAHRLHLFILAINVLKHGDGRSYEALLAEKGLPFRIKRRDEPFFHEGDVSEIATFVQADDEFVLNCATLISEVTVELRKSGRLRP
jgi:hypothetical protein